MRILSQSEESEWGVEFDSQIQESEAMTAKHWESPRSFEWLQPKLSGPYLLLLDGREVGRMVRPSWMSSVWHGQSEFGRWKLADVGFWRRHYEARDLETDELLGDYRMKWHAAEGTLSLPEGHALAWRQRGWLNRTAAFVDSSHREIVQLRMGRERGGERFSDVFKTQGTVSTSPGRHMPRTVCLLVFFAWFLVMVQQEEASAIAASTAAVS